MRRLRCPGAHDGKNKRGKYRMAPGKALAQTAPKLIQLSVCLSRSLVWEERGTICVLLCLKK